MSKKNSNNRLDIDRGNIKPQPKKPMTQEEAAEMMGAFYDTMGNCFINLVAIQAKATEIFGVMVKTIGEIAVDTNDIAFYAKQTALKNESVTDVDIIEHEKGDLEGDDDDDDDDTNPKAPDD